MAGRGADSRRRLERAAWEIYRDRGYQEVTAATIAERAGLTERTFFRHFSDKRDMLFSDGQAMQDLAADAIRSAASGSPFDRALAGLRAVVPLFGQRIDLVRERQRIIAADVDLQERELGKRAQFVDAISAALTATGVDRSTAALVGALSELVFHDAFTRWIADGAAGLTAAGLAAGIDASAVRVRQAVGGD